ncbi:spore maturation protein A [Blautia luti]|uniref:Nucleoside recognition protein n=1 Tax=Blautia luti DSM 14534 = JCM 17040 TaxID=649762 RepID=A0A844GR64_9FIRM|nr:nucleoside recognition protein [Blautia luti]MTD62215.1 nucleoside recognition protein [Blautia luti DSM 14534 = JCM 17040]BEI59102.1 spore maturation protein A [Blautia luti]
MTYLWSGMILVGIIYGLLTGNLKAVTEAVVSSSRESVNLCISMAGIVGMWTGLMKIAEGSGLIEGLSGKMGPVLRFLFPGLDPDSMAGRYISVNFLSNILGLGWAATPAGLKAMESLAEAEEEKRISGIQAAPSGTATDEMCTFLIINISSLQLIPVNIIAYRVQYGSANPTAVIGPAIAATAVSTGAAVIFCWIMNRKGRAG